MPPPGRPGGPPRMSPGPPERTSGARWRRRGAPAGAGHRRRAAMGSPSEGVRPGAAGGRAGVGGLGPAGVGRLGPAAVGRLLARAWPGSAARGRLGGRPPSPGARARESQTGEGAVGAVVDQCGRAHRLGAAESSSPPVGERPAAQGAGRGNGSAPRGPQGVKNRRAVAALGAWIASFSLSFLSGRIVPGQRAVGPGTGRPADGARWRARSHGRICRGAWHAPEVLSYLVVAPAWTLRSPAAVSYPQASEIVIQAERAPRWFDRYPREGRDFTYR